MVSKEYWNIVYRGYIVMKRGEDPSIIFSMMITILTVKIQNIIVIPTIPRIFVTTERTNSPYFCSCYRDYYYDHLPLLFVPILSLISSLLLLHVVVTTEQVPAPLPSGCPCRPNPLFSSGFGVDIPFNPMLF